MRPSFGKIEAGVAQRRDIGQRDPVDPFEREHFPRRAVPVDRRDPEVRVARDIFAEFARGGGLEPEIHLHAHRAGQRIDDLDELEAPRLGKMAFGETRGKIHVRQITPEKVHDPRPQHLDRDGAFAVGVAYPGAMDLRDRGRRHRFAEFAENRIDRLAESRLHRRDRVGARKRGHAVLQHFEIGAPPPDRRCRRASPETGRA